MNDFDYAAATTVDEAVSLLAAQGDRAKVLAGGTDIIVQLRENLRHADLVVDVKKIGELMELRYDAKQGLRLGAAVPCYRLCENQEICAAYPALVDAARIIGGWQIQGRASIGGNLCNASPAADAIPALIALGAVAEVAGPGGRRRVPVDEFCTGPGRTVLGRGELLVALEVPAPVARASSAYERFIPRNEMDIAVVGVGSWLQLNAAGDKIEAARIALGAVAPTPLYAQAASDWLQGQAATEATYQKAGELAKQIARPISDKRGPAEYREHLVGVLVVRTLRTAQSRVQEGENVSR